MRPKRLALRGPLEREIQPWILASIGVEQFEIKKTRSGRMTRVGLNTWIADGGRCVFHRNNTGGTRTAGGGFLRFGLGKGGADIVGVAYGRPIALEVKREGESQTAEQRRWQSDFEAAGGVYAVVRSPDEARSVIEAIRRQAVAV
jgi:hypothetical protein